MDAPFGLFPPGLDPSKMYNPLMELSDPRTMHPDHQSSSFLKKKCKYYWQFYSFLYLPF